ncbi:hypothetical protein QR680_010293 [Steinernema hermaphroditum]|uniref:DUF7087 domain-containing protein n=1 Tax=Steinernema hermaphroditum TaxID=289476 RepID=A0AA39IQ37_9BILA|nr:hypothetical protein QR680_010293 [Steinernema hermaphroditum]
MFTGHKPIDRNFPTLMYELRGAELLGCCIQVLVLYMEHEQIGYGNFLLPTIFLGVHIALVFSRWFNEVDGRYDFQQMMSVHSDSSTKADYAFGLYGGFVLALIVHFVAADMHSGLSSFVFRFSDYVAVLSAAFCCAVESFEGAKAKYF